MKKTGFIGGGLGTLLCATWWAIAAAAVPSACADDRPPYRDGRPAATWRIDAKDQGVVLRYGNGPDQCDYLGAREAIVFQSGGTYHLHYDGAGPRGWLACLATSNDLVHWAKKGPILDFGKPGEPDSACACSPWVYFDGTLWHMFYVATPFATPPPERIPAVPYLTCKATSRSPGGPWIKQKDLVPFRPKPGTYYADTANSGCVVKHGDEYLMFFSAAAFTADAARVLKRTLGIARTKNLDGLWQVDPQPVVPPEEQIENSSLYFEPGIQTWFLFTNHIGIDSRGEYTDGIWVYWSKDLNRWDPQSKAVVLDGRNCSWSKGCIGMPTVIPAGRRLALLYDAPGGKSVSHVRRSIGLAWLDLPLAPPGPGARAAEAKTSHPVPNASPKPPAAAKMIGMYVHQHWPYNHPYAARTWTLEDWRGYADGLHKLGYNAIMIWPMLETMPDPLAPSDRAYLEKTAKVIDMLHGEFGMRVWLALCPNVSANDREAAKATIERRHFFYCDTRVNPADPAAMRALMTRREKLLRPLAKADAVSIIDSDPGGYPGSTNAQFVGLLGEHRRLFDRLRPGIELVYWMHVGWEGYGRFYRTGKFSWGTEQEHLDALTRLKALNPEPWGIANGLVHAKKLGLQSRVVSFSYGRIEGEPSFPMTNFGGDVAYQGGKDATARGLMGNAQTHCLQLPNTFAFARGAAGLPLADQDYVGFADDLIPGQGKCIVEAWRALAGSDVAAMRTLADTLQGLPDASLVPGRLKGLLFGSPRRFIMDLVMQLRARAAFETFRSAAAANRDLQTPLREFVAAVQTWQHQHGYENAWWWPGLNESLRKLNAPEVNAVLNTQFYLDAAPPPDWKETPYEFTHKMLRDTESYTPRLIAAMKQVVKPKTRRVLYNLDGDSCMWTKKGAKTPVPVGPDELKTVVDEIASPGSQVDTLLVCINAQCMYYPTKIGDRRGTLATPAQRGKWPQSEQQRFRNVEAMFAQGVDPYALLLAEARRHGLESLLTYRMNDIHGDAFLEHKFWLQHPEYRLPKPFDSWAIRHAGLDFGQDAVRDYTFRLIEEAVLRYDCDGIELDFNRSPAFFQSGTEAERIATINTLVQRVRQMLHSEGRKRGRRLVLAARVLPGYQQCRNTGLDPRVWAKEGWIDFLTVSPYSGTQYDLPIKPWKERIKNVPIYGCADSAGSAANYRLAAKHFWNDGADGIYLFNFFCPREWFVEPPFEVLKELGDPAYCHRPE